MKDQPSATILYHFFYPDDVVSARHFSDFAEELVNRGWKVSVLTSNKYCRYLKKKIVMKEENWKGIEIHRITRPAWAQANNFFRIANSLWMMAGWVLKLLTLPKSDVLIIGSDPQFSQFLFPVLRFFKRQRSLVYWCYDLYPEAIIADGVGGIVRWAAERVRPLMKRTYKSVDLIVDIGPCMRKRFDVYGPKAHRATLTPWALVEPEEPKRADSNTSTRYELFGHAKLGLLYSGNIGKAHDFTLFLKLARDLYRKDSNIIFCFACRGNRFEELKNSVRPNDLNIRFAPFADEARLEQRLSSADIHLLSLRPGWEGIVVPSKFFGSLAIGRPVMYAGPEDSAIAEWIHKFKVGLILREDNIEQVSTELLEITKNPEKLQTWQKNALKAYHRYFSKKVVMDQWDRILRDLIHYG